MIETQILCAVFVQTPSEWKVFVNTVICLVLKTSTGNLFCARNDDRLAKMMKNLGMMLRVLVGLVLNFLPDCFMSFSAFCLLQDPFPVFCTKDRDTFSGNVKIYIESQHKQLNEKVTA